jgi:hypothetical protein
VSIEIGTPSALEGRDHRIEPADFLLRRHGLGRDVAGGGAQFDDVGAAGDEPACLGDRRHQVEIAPAVG